MENTFNERGVTVTRNGLSSAGLVFPLRDIRDLSVITVEKSRTVPILISLVGAVAAVAGILYPSSAALVAGVMLVVVGYLAWISQDVTYRLIVETPDGRREAVASLERDFVERVGEAVRRLLAAQAAQATQPAAASR